MTAPFPIRLGINIDHVATLRNARGGTHPDPLHAAAIAIETGPRKQGARMAPKLHGEVPVRPHIVISSERSEPTLSS